MDHSSSSKHAGDSAYIIPNLDRALRIMEHLSTRQEGGTITEIATQLSLPKNSVFRIVRTLAASGYLDEHGKSWRLSPKILSLGYTAVQNTHLIDACMDGMRALRDEINETIFVGALSEGKVVILEELPSFQLVKFTVEIGHKVPIHASAPGKAILAHLPPAEQKELLAHIAFTRFNDRTIPGDEGHAGRDREDPAARLRAGPRRGGRRDLVRCQPGAGLPRVSHCVLVALGP